MTINNLHEPLQSAYRKGYSTETALVRITNDVLLDIDERRGVVLVLLDLSAAFDTIDHDILTHRLSHRVGVKHTALAWFDSYHTGRTQRVCISGVTSNSVTLKCGGPQGSLMGAEDYKVYILPVGDIIRKHRLRFNIYADDKQLSIAFDLRSSEDLKSKIVLIEKCVQEIKQWMTVNMLKLNAEKTEVLIITSPHFKERVDSHTVSVEGTDVIPSPSVRNIGVTFDSTLSMHAHISTICKKMFSPSAQYCIYQKVYSKRCMRESHTCNDYITHRLRKRNLGRLTQLRTRQATAYTKHGGQSNLPEKKI